MKVSIQRQRLWQLKMQSEGRCPRCGKRKESVRGEHLYCKACANKASETVLNRYYDRKSRGLCPVCGKRKPPKGRVLCCKCLELNQSRLRRHAKRGT